MSDEPVRICPSCGEPRVERLISAGGGIVFKGPGFYATDYRRPEAGRGASSGEKESAGASEDGGAGSSAGKGEGGPSKEPRSGEDGPS